MIVKHDSLRWIAGIVAAAAMAFSIGALSASPANSQAAGSGECPLANQFCGNNNLETPPDLDFGNGNGASNGAANGATNGATNGAENGASNGLDNGVPV